MHAVSALGMFNIYRIVLDRFLLHVDRDRIAATHAIQSSPLSFSFRFHPIAVTDFNPLPIGLVPSPPQRIVTLISLRMCRRFFRRYNLPRFDFLKAVRRPHSLKLNRLKVSHPRRKRRRQELIALKHKVKHS